MPCNDGLRRSITLCRALPLGSSRALLQKEPMKRVLLFIALAGVILSPSLSYMTESGLWIPSAMLSIRPGASSTLSGAPVG